MKKIGLIAVLVLALVTVFQAFDDDPHGPVVVKKLAFVNQTASVTATTLYTPAADGDYELIAYEVLNPPDVNSFGQYAPVGFIPHGSWTDESRTMTYAFTGIGAGLSGDCECFQSSSSIHIHAKAGNPIQFSGQYYAGTGSSAIPVDIFVTLIKQ